MWIKVHISRKLVWSAATKYSIEPKRVFMEFIDNSLDSAEDFFNEQTNSYSKPIKIDVLVNYTTNCVTISDNCTWIPDIWKVVQTIWDSNKANIKQKNWQFWFGMYSFMSIAENLRITSKIVWSTAKTISIPKSIFYEWADNEAIVDDPVDTTYKYDSWTEIVISNINKWVLKKDSKNFKISIDDLINEVQKHFEWLLWRENLEINISDWIVTKRCYQFDYDKYEWSPFEEYIDHNELYLKGYDWNFDVKIYLKITNDKQLNRPPFFMIKGRRIYDIKDCKEFMKKSVYQRSIWDHPSIIWYIDLWDTVEPVLERDSFNMMWKKWDVCKALFKKIVDKEEDIMKLLEKINRSTEDRHFKNLEDKLTSILSQLSREDKMNYRQEQANKWESQVWWFEWWVEWSGWDYWFWAQDYSNWNINDSNKDRNFWWWEWDWYGPNWDEWNEFAWEDPMDNSMFKWSSDFWAEFMNTAAKKKSWFSIKFKDWEPPTIEWTNKKTRSNLVWWEIWIFKEHPDFLSRKRTWSNNELILTERLVTYIAWEITVHYKDEFYNKNWQPERNIEMFESVVEFIYKFENQLKDLIWKDLSNI